MRSVGHNLQVYGVLCAVLILCAAPSIASELKFQFINPSFGGSPLNGSYLLGSASAQNDFTEDKDVDLLADFEEQLTRRILSDVSRKITQDAFGVDDLQAGVYEIGDFIIDVDSGGGSGVMVEILDTSTGSSTVVEVPGF